MLRKIPRILNPDFMKILLEMGHGDEIVFGDANFPADSMGQRVVHLEGNRVTEILEALMPFFPLDNYAGENAILMSVVPGHGQEPEVWNRYRETIHKYDEEAYFQEFSFLTREEFYERSKTAYAVVATGEREKYANLILKLGVVEGEKKCYDKTGNRSSAAGI